MFLVIVYGFVEQILIMFGAVQRKQQQQQQQQKQQQRQQTIISG